MKGHVFLDLGKYLLAFFIYSGMQMRLLFLEQDSVDITTKKLGIIFVT